MHIVPPSTKRTRADKYLATLHPEHSRAALQRAFDSHLVLINGTPADKSATIRPGDTIAFTLPPIQPSELRPVSIPLNILYEDQHLIALNKPSGMTVHPGSNTGDSTLTHALLAHCSDGNLSTIGGVERPGIVHRLDRETSGVMIVAKNDITHRHLAQQFAARTTQKQYLALVSGSPAQLSGTIQKPIGRDPVHRHKMSVRPLTDTRARAAHTDWQLQQKLRNAALLLCTLHTGRTHQIRVHLKSIHHPILGDTTYGYRPAKDSPKIPRVMLHSHRLTITHPLTQKPLTFTAPPPVDFQSLLHSLQLK